MDPQHDAVVAQDTHTVAPHPQPRRRRLAGAGLAGEQVPGAGLVDEAAGMDLDAEAAAEQVREQDLVEWVLDRVYRVAVEVRTVDDEAATGEVTGESRDAVGRGAERGRDEAEQQAVPVTIELPERARIEQALRRDAFARQIAGRHVHDRVGITARNDEAGGRARHLQPQWLIARDPGGDPRDRHAEPAPRSRVADGVWHGGIHWSHARCAQDAGELHGAGATHVG
jgi:hypothetical protein